MGNYWGKSLGVIELALVRREGHWHIDAPATHSEVRNVKKADGTFVAPDAAVAGLVKPVHDATVAYVTTPIGASDFAMTTYFADVGDVSALQPVNTAQREYVERYIATNLPQYAGVPVLSAAAPFKGGFGGSADYTDIAAGPLAIRNAADLYLYPNTLTAVKIDGAILKAWLERAAARFNRIDPAKREPQQLVNRKVPSYNFDVIQGGLTYAIDVTRPEQDRIRDLRFHGRPVEAAQRFIVVTNNYRASGGGHFPGLDGSNIVLSAPDANRDVLIDWVRQRKHLSRAADGSERNWRFARLQAAASPTLSGGVRAAIVDTLKYAADLLEKDGIEIVLEPIDLLEHKQEAVTSVTEAFEITREVASPRIKVLYDFYHEQRQAGNLIEKLEKNIDQVGLVHIADVPGRHQPGTGEVNYGNIYRKLGELHYDRYICMEFSPIGDPVTVLKAARLEAISLMHSVHK
jgi:hypothetical protein